MRYRGARRSAQLVGAGISGDIAFQGVHVVDLDAYFERIGYRGTREPNLVLLRSLHRLHPSAIAFESLDPLLGRPVAIDVQSLETKIVRMGRGGYCFEQNGFFLHVLSTLGFAVTPLAARVRWMLQPDAPQTPVSHMPLKTVLPEGTFVCDVGFGGQSPTAPLHLEPGLVQETEHGIYRFCGARTGYDLEMRLPDGWAAMYRFTEEPQTPRDYEVYNWFTATHPASRFVNNLVAARVAGEDRLTLFNTELTLQRRDGRREHRLLGSPTELHGVLTRDFGIRIARAEIENVWRRLPKPADLADAGSQSSEGENR
jgi:N-hydroxyarylamine O-acetyltransferase